jgi:erythromycin esterase-like protein
MQTRASELGSRNAKLDPDAFFIAEQNARLVKNAERITGQCSRAGLTPGTFAINTWSRPLKHWSVFSVHRAKSCWAHNSHLGDARATEMGERGELNVGQLVRQRRGKAAVLVGFTTNSGTVTAASNWDGPAERKRVRPAVGGSYESLFHETGIPGFLLDLRGKEWFAECSIRSGSSAQSA